ncbi:MAG TPA: DUF4333 domain-containing protein [Mycobacterium sp.]|nr:DUF4333 domain-containing protein [Mycobacterium sp.]
MFAVAAGLLTAAGWAPNTPPPEKTVARNDVANEVSAKVNEQSGHRPDSVTCSRDLRAKVGAVLVCEERNDGQTYGIDVTVTRVDGDNVSFDIVETVNKDDIANEIGDQMAEQFGGKPSVTCPDNLNGDVGATLRCQLQAGDATYGVTVTVTSVDGGSVKHTFKVDDRPQ